MADQDQQIADAVLRDQAKLRNFIRRRVPDPADAEDILQDVFSELVEAYRMMNPIDQVTAWLYRVARNRITDLFRKRDRQAAPAERVRSAPDESADSSLDRFASRDAGPEAAFMRTVLLEELADALEELPQQQRDVFVAHEIQGHSFKEIAAQTGVPINTLLSRKHYAVLHLRRRLQDFYDEFTETGD